MKSRFLSVCMATLALLVIAAPLSARDRAPDHPDLPGMVRGTEAALFIRQSTAVTAGRRSLESVAALFWKQGAAPQGQ